MKIVGLVKAVLDVNRRVLNEAVFVTPSYRVFTQVDVVSFKSTYLLCWHTGTAMKLAHNDEKIQIDDAPKVNIYSRLVYPSPTPDI